MVIITGSILGTAETIDELVEQSLAHVRRSREEPGCLSHDVHRHVEEPLRLVFVERWADMDAVQRHFVVPEAGEFVQRAGELSAEPPSIQIYDAQQVGG